MFIYSETDYHGAIDSDYRRYHYFAWRANLLDERYGHLRRQPTLVAGCAWGFLLDELARRRWTSVYGFDASPYAVERALGPRVLLADVLQLDDLDAVVDYMGAPPRLIITEDLLPCAQDRDEALLVVEHLHGILADEGEVLHFITPAHQGMGGPFLWLDLDEWRSLLPGDVVQDSML